jgi:hypothetical protein
MAAISISTRAYARPMIEVAAISIPTRSYIELELICWSCNKFHACVYSSPQSSHDLMNFPRSFLGGSPSSLSPAQRRRTGDARDRLVYHRCPTAYRSARNSPKTLDFTDTHSKPCWNSKTYRHYFHFRLFSYTSYQLPAHCLAHSHSVNLSSPHSVRPRRSLVVEDCYFSLTFWQINSGKKHHVSLLQWNLRVSRSSSRRPKHMRCELLSWFHDLADS